MVVMNKTEHQGYLCGIENKSRDEITELLHRQQKILKNVKFISRLADKGEKIRCMVKKLQQILAQKEDVDNTAKLFQKMALKTDHGDDHEQDVLQAVINREYKQVVIDERLTAPDERLTAPDERLTAPDERNVPDTSLDRAQPKYVNNYHKVIKQSETAAGKTWTKFKPHRTVNMSNVGEVIHKLGKASLGEAKDTVVMDTALISDATSHSNVIEKADVMEEDITEPSPPKTRTAENMLSPIPLLSKLKYDENLQYKTDIKPTKYMSAQMVDIEESFRLQTEQKRKQEELQSQLAGERLAHRLNIKMSTFSPEGTTSYRDTNDSAESDNDSDDEQQDYPD